MTITDAQADLRRAYIGGGPGVMVSGLVWLTAALVTQAKGIPTGFAALFIGGMFIFPLSKLVLKLLRAPAETPGSPIAIVALESTIAMLGGLLAAWLFLHFDPWLTFPIAAIAVGTHYFAFRTAYGENLFWLLGAAITVVGVFEVLGVTMLGIKLIYAVAAIEAVFAILLARRAKAESKLAGA